LIGTPESCIRTAEELFRAGVDEIACLVDFGVPRDAAIASLYEVEQVRAQLNRSTASDIRVPQLPAVVEGLS